MTLDKALDGVTNPTERYLDGQTKRVLENGVVMQSYAYGVNPDGTRWTLSASGPLPAIAPLTDVADLRSLTSGLDFPWQLTVSDSLNHPVATHKPGFSHTVLLRCYGTADGPHRPVLSAKEPFLPGFEAFSSSLMGQHG